MGPHEFFARASSEVQEELEDRIAELESENAKLRARIKELTPWAKFGVSQSDYVFDDPDLQEAAIAAGALLEVPGGYDPEVDCDYYDYGAEPGDLWYEKATIPMFDEEAPHD